MMNGPAEARVISRASFACVLNPSGMLLRDPGGCGTQHGPEKRAVSED